MQIRSIGIAGAGAWGTALALQAARAGLATTLMAGLGVSLVLFGVENHVEYLSVLSFLSRHGESFWANQSINGLLNRLVVASNDADFDPYGFPPFHLGVYLGTLLTSLVLVGAALIRPRPATPAAWTACRRRARPPSTRRTSPTSRASCATGPR